MATYLRMKRRNAFSSVSREAHLIRQLCASYVGTNSQSLNHENNHGCNQKPSKINLNIREASKCYFAAPSA